MLAVLAVICFIIAQFESALGPVNLLLLGLAFLALHFVFGGGWRPARPGGAA